jgi:ribosome recycling factor
MKRSIISQYDQLKDRLGNYVGLMNYRYMNLCVKAEEASLLPVTVIIEDEAKRIEEIANIAKDGDYAFKVFPQYEEDLIAIGKGIAQVHPEFKLEEGNMHVELDEGESQDVSFIHVIMPDVNKDRRDLLNKAVDALYEECKTQMEAAKTEAEAKIAILSVGENEKEIDKLKEAIKKLVKTWTDKREQVHQDKLKEIEDGYNKYLTDQSEAAQKRQENEMAAGDGGKSFNMNNYQG